MFVLLERQLLRISFFCSLLFILYADFFNLLLTTSNYCSIISLFITYHHFNHVCLLLEFLHLLLSDDNMDPSKDWTKIKLCLRFESFFLYAILPLFCTCKLYVVNVLRIQLTLMNESNQIIENPGYS